MGLFSKLFGEKTDSAGTIDIVAPLSGEIVNIEDVPDVVFAEKIVGDGIAIKPSGNKMVAPVDGTIGKILKPITLFRSNQTMALSCSSTSVSIR